MKCTSCGNELSQSDKFCSNCGQSNEYFIEPLTRQATVVSQSENSASSKPAESSTLSICALIFAFLGGWLGFILSIIGLCVSKESSNRRRCVAALFIVIFWFVLAIIVGILGAGI